MSMGTPINPCRTVSFAAAEVFVVDGVKTSAATVAAPVTVLAESMTGAAMSVTPGTFDKLARSITITRSHSVGSYTTAPIVVTGVRDGRQDTENLVPADADGGSSGDAIRGTKLWERLIKIDFPAQVDTNGTFKIGCQDIGRPCKNDNFSGVELAASGYINAQFGEQPGSPRDTKPAAANQFNGMNPTRIRTDPTLSNPTTVGLTVYCP